MELMLGDIELGHLLVSDLDAGRIGVDIFHSGHGQVRFCLRVAEEFQHDLVGDEWFSPPINGNEREEWMFDGRTDAYHFSIPLGSSRRVVTDMDRQSGLIGELLQRYFP